MKKMMKNYEAPVAEMFEMHMPTVLMGSTENTGSSDAPGSSTGGTWG